jgi:hypothetical protein
MLTNEFINYESALLKSDLSSFYYFQVLMLEVVIPLPAADFSIYRRSYFLFKGILNTEIV